MAVNILTYGSCGFDCVDGGVCVCRTDTRGQGYSSDHWRGRSRGLQRNDGDWMRLTQQGQLKGCLRPKCTTS